MTNSPSVFQTTMSSREIAELVESNHADVRRSIERLAATVDSKGNPKTPVITLPPLAEVSNAGPGPKTISVYHLCKRDSLIVVAQLCPEFTARVIDRWQELEAVVAQPVQPVQALIGDIAAAELRMLDTLKNSLNLCNSSHLGLVHSTLNVHGYERISKALPQYAIDAPTSSTTGSSEPTASASTLLKKHDIKMSTVKFNTKLVEIGLLADMTRPSTSSPTGFKTFKAVVGKGLDYGKNVTNPGNPRETQPHWYSHKFLDLIDLLK
jgi:phage regulator Rha-like protein